jgi:pyruvate formate lyase activating enzyme
MNDRGPTPVTTLLAAHDIARAAGLHYVYTGNVYDPEHQHTYCPGCGRAVIQRNGYMIAAFELKDGRCIHCQTPITGRFDETAGTWGSRRMPVRI